MVAAFGRGDADGVVEHLAEDFEHYGIDKRSAREQLRKVINDYGIWDVKAWNYDITEINWPAGSAKAEFNLRVASAEHEVYRPYLIRAEFKHENGAWKLRRFERFNPFANTDQKIPFPMP
jgi:hypothetical protein